MRKGSLRSLGALLALCASALGCDDGSGSAALGQSCPAFRACGGNLVGAWTLQDLCYGKSLKQAASDMFGSACADELQSYAVHWSAAFTFNGDGTDSGEVGQISIGESLLVTQACVNAIANTLGADPIPVSQFCSNLESNSQRQGGKASCHASAGSCACDISIVSSQSVPMHQSGRYSVMGDQLFSDLTMGSGLTMGMDLMMMGVGGATAGASDGSDAGSGGVPFCVRGDTLSLSITTSTADSTDLSATLVFSRKSQ
jgi:hypothetical protein